MATLSKFDRVRRVFRRGPDPERKNLSVEAQANVYALHCLTYALMTLVFVWLLNVLNIFIVEQKLMLMATLVSAILLLIPKIICRYAGVEESWIKYLILCFTSTAISVYGLALSYHAILLFNLPLLFAAQYQSRKVMFSTYGFVLGVMLLSVVGSYWVGLCDTNMLLLSAFPTKHYVDFATGVLKNLTPNPDPWVTIPLFFFVPRALSLLVFIPVLTHLVDMSAENAVAMTELSRMSETDRTTRFYNKNKYDQMLEKYYPSVERVGIIFWDLNNLKVINDTYGHTQGDFVISALAGCISDLVLNMRQVFRIGGDEFVMALEDPEEGETEQVVNAVREKIEQRNATSRIPISAAVGWSEGPGVNILDVIERADANMYIDKRGHKATEVPEELQNTILSDRLFEGLASVSENTYVFLCDMRTNMSRWSASAVEYFDMPGEFMSNADEVWSRRMHPDDRKSFQEELRNVFAGQSIYLKGEYRVMNRSGEYVWLECRANVTYDEVRQARYMSGMIHRLDSRNKYDPLTKLKTIYEFNNIGFEDRKGALMLIGLDDFRMIINNNGYAYGDIVMMDFAQRLARLCGEKQTPFRMEGDEFLILCPDMDRDAVRELFNSIRSLGLGLGKEAGRLVNVWFSGGAVLFPEHGTRREELIGNLEHSLEMAKSDHRGELVFFHEEIAEAHMRASIIKERLSRVAKENFEGFMLNFQPLVRTSDFKTVSCEALLRCPELAAQGIQISDVVSYMEKSGEIIAMGLWVAEQVFIRAARWQREFPELSVSFNVSTVQIQDPKFVDQLIDLSRKYDLDPSRIVVEITESSELEDYYSACRYLSRLREFGFKIALDDFGIAYSTLLLIKTLPVDCVKIDHSFVIHLHRAVDNKDLMIVESVIDLCRKLSIRVTAEGVENEEILKILEAYPIDYYQGYYFARPLPEEEFIARLGANA